MTTEMPRRTVFFPQGWGLGECMDLGESVHSSLEVLHDLAADGEAGNDDDTSYEDIRRQVLTFADEIEKPLDIVPRSDGSVRDRLGWNTTWVST